MHPHKADEATGLTAAAKNASSVASSTTFNFGSGPRRSGAVKQKHGVIHPSYTLPALFGRRAEQLVRPLPR